MPDQVDANLQFQYAWNWFSYHAGQRLTAFNFFLIVLGAEIIGYTQAAIHRLEGLGVGLGALGAVVAMAFWAMDIRNSELVEYGREALKAVETAPIDITKADHDRTRLLAAVHAPVEVEFAEWIKAEDAERFFTHSFWLRKVLAAAGWASVGAAVWAGFGFPNF